MLLPADADDVCDDRRMAVVVWTWRKREGPRVGRAWNAVETGVERSKRRAVADLILVRGWREVAVDGGGEFEILGIFDVMRRVET